MLPVSPEAAKQNQTQSIPVNFYTGTPQITLPIYTLQEGNLAVPVYLAYNASGIQAGEVASWCGLGWTSVAGGMISRMVRGLPDEGLDDGVTRIGYFRRDSRGVIRTKDDFESDIYILSIHGTSYKFCFDEENRVHFIPENDIKVEPVVKRNRNNAALLWFSGWNVTLPDGTRYRFGRWNANAATADATDEWEFTLTKDANAGEPTASEAARINPSAWYMTRIESPFGQTIEFDYQRSYYSYLQLRDCEANQGDSQVQQKVDRIYVGSLVLSAIRGKNTNVLFNSDFSRCATTTDVYVGGPVDIFSQFCPLDVSNDPRPDLLPWTSVNANSKGSKRLNRITIREITAGTPKELLFGFEYDYFTGGGQSFPAIAGYANVNSAHSRLRLKRVLFPDNSTCTLGYNNQSDPIPSRLTRGVDHWGYFNGAFGATHLLGVGLCQGATSFPVANRTPTEAWAKYCSLNQVGYSTGSTLLLEYEGHTVRNDETGGVGGIRVKRITALDSISGLHTVREFNYLRPGTTLSSGFLTLPPVYRFDIRDANEQLYAEAAASDSTRKTANDSLKAALPSTVYNSYLYGQALARSGKPFVGYRHVRETLYSGRIDFSRFANNASYKDSLRLGATQYEFDQDSTEIDVCDGPVDFSHYPWRYRPDFDYRAGTLLRMVDYGRAGQIRSEQRTNYAGAISFDGLVNPLNRNNYGIGVGIVLLRYNGQVSGNVSAAQYVKYFQRYGPASQRVRLYNEPGTDFIETTTTYRYKDQMHQYDSDYLTKYPGRHTQVCQVQITDAQGRLNEIFTTYVGDFNYGTQEQAIPQSCYDETTNTTRDSCYTIYQQTDAIPTDPTAQAIYQMRLKNMKGAVVETYTKRSGQYITAMLQTYKTNGADAGTAQAGEPFQTFRLENFPLPVFYPMTIDQTNKDNNYLLVATVNRYNSIGLPLSVSANFGIETRTAYGYNNLLPTSTTVGAGLSESKTTTYEYTVPMFGLSRQTTPNGQRTSYEYEGATGRLQLLRNTNDAIIRRYTYKLKNQ